MLVAGFSEGVCPIELDGFSSHVNVSLLEGNP